MKRSKSSEWIMFNVGRNAETTELTLPKDQFEGTYGVL